MGLRYLRFHCDNDEDPPLPPAVEKVVLAFGVDQGEGQLSAKPELENTAAEKIGELICPASTMRHASGKPGLSTAMTFTMNTAHTTSKAVRQPFLFRQLSPFHKPMPPIPFTIFLVTFLPISLLASLAASCCTAFIACCRISAVVPFLIAFRYSKLSFISLL